MLDELSCPRVEIGLFATEAQKVEFRVSSVFSVARASFNLVWTRPRHSGASRNLDVRRYVRSLDSGLRRNDQEHVQTNLGHALILLILKILIKSRFKTKNKP